MNGTSEVKQYNLSTKDIKSFYQQDLISLINNIQNILNEDIIELEIIEKNGILYTLQAI